MVEEVASEYEAKVFDEKFTEVVTGDHEATVFDEDKKVEVVVSHHETNSFTENRDVVISDCEVNLFKEDNDMEVVASEFEDKSIGREQHIQISISDLHRLPDKEIGRIHALHPEKDNEGEIVICPADMNANDGYSISENVCHDSFINRRSVISQTKSRINKTTLADETGVFAANLESSAGIGICNITERRDDEFEDNESTLEIVCIISEKEYRELVAVTDSNDAMDTPNFLEKDLCLYENKVSGIADIVNCRVDEEPLNEASEMTHIDNSRINEVPLNEGSEMMHIDNSRIDKEPLNVASEVSSIDNCRIDEERLDVASKTTHIDYCTKDDASWNEACEMTSINNSRIDDEQLIEAFKITSIHKRRMDEDQLTKSKEVPLNFLKHQLRLRRSNGTFEAGVNPPAKRCRIRKILHTSRSKDGVDVNIDEIPTPSTGITENEIISRKNSKNELIVIASYAYCTGSKCIMQDICLTDDASCDPNYNVF